MNEREITITGDGSNTVSVPALKVAYHSIHGAVQESMRVFIEAGLHYILGNSSNQPINVFEMGFGTGLNAFLTAIEAEAKKIKIKYTAIDAFPLSFEEASSLNYTHLLGNEKIFQQLHQLKWNEEVHITEYFSITKQQIELQNYSTHQQFNIIYYDAFAPTAQPELWTKEIFEKLHEMLSPGGVLVTYCSKGNVRRAMLAAGFKVTKLPGPPRKREMLRAEKLLLL